MATYGKKLLDMNGNVILPKTRSSLVYMDDNETVEDTINKILNGTTAVGKATKLATARKIGNASFDGSGNITLAQMGAQSELSIVNEDITSSCTGTNLDIRFVHHQQYGKLHILYIEATNTASEATWATNITFPSKLNIPTRDTFQIRATGSGFLDPQWYPIVAENSTRERNKLYFRKSAVPLNVGLLFEIAVVYMEPYWWQAT